jgi:hypothetical protein
VLHAPPISSSPNTLTFSHTKLLLRLMTLFRFEMLWRTSSNERGGSCLILAMVYQLHSQVYTPIEGRQWIKKEVDGSRLSIFLQEPPKTRKPVSMASLRSKNLTRKYPNTNRCSHVKITCRTRIWKKVNMTKLRVNLPERQRTDLGRPEITLLTA